MLYHFKLFIKGFVVFSVFIFITACNRNDIARVGKLAPEIGAVDLESNTIRLADLRGKVQILNFWQGGCTPCLTEMPHLQAFHEGWHDKGVHVLSINNGGGPRIVRNVIEDTAVTFDFAIDEISVSATRYQVRFFPTTYVLDRNGIVVDRIIGEVHEEQLAKIVGPLL